ncbi:MAG TPA: LytTR family transcriptional regulator [Aliiroseovarius sp.]|nr:LytTR family transcriptional regulator [Aliiroseovarius sp.]
MKCSGHVVADRALHLALREMRAHFSHARTWVFLLVAGVLLGWSGPFDTFRELDLVARLLYWLVLVGATYATGVFVHGWAGHAFALHQTGFWRATLLGGVLTGLAVTLVLLGINWAGLGLPPAGRAYLLAITGEAIGVSLLVSVTLALIRRDHAATPQPPKPARILARLPLEKRGALISLSVQDHYVDVVTSKGHEMLLMRLRDAMAETEGVEGLQVHRSHWVALAEVRGAKRLGDKAELRLSDGRDIPVSRTYVKAIRAAGLLP